MGRRIHWFSHMIQRAEPNLEASTLKRKEGDLISTGEAARMLNVSISTAVRYFDSGVLKGEKHPITGWRRVYKGSVISLLERYRSRTNLSILFEKENAHSA